MDAIRRRKLANIGIVIGVILSLLIAMAMSGIMLVTIGLMSRDSYCYPDFPVYVSELFCVYALFVTPFWLIHCLFLLWHSIRREAAIWMAWLPILLFLLAFGFLFAAEFADVFASREHCAASSHPERADNTAPNSPLSKPMLWIAGCCAMAIPFASLFAMLMPPREA